MLFNLDGKNALVTGAGGGIGQEIAKALHKQGAVVGLASLNYDKVKAFAEKELKDRYIVFNSLNLGVEESIQALVKSVEEQFSSIDILVNNAGITRDSLAMRLKKEDWDEVINVNLTGVFLLTKPIFTKMLKQRYGRIINVASVVGIMGNVGQLNYAASKGGLIAMTKTLAREGATRGVTANSVAPGFINTPMLSTIPAEQLQEMLKNVPLGRLGDAHEVAATVAFLASKEAGYITGHTLNINGGIVME